MIQDPAQFWSGKIGGERQTNLATQLVLAANGGEIFTNLRRARVLPDNRVADRFPGATIPHHRRFALIGNADSGNIARLNAALAQSVCDNRLHALPDFLRVVFDPARLWIDLTMFSLSDGND